MSYRSTAFSCYTEIRKQLSVKKMENSICKGEEYE